MRISDWSSDVCSSDLWKNIQDYIVDPESLPPEEPNPLQKAELDEKLTNIDVAKRTINIREAQAAGEERRKDAELLLKRHDRSEEHTSELQSLMRISYAVFCLKQKKKKSN